MHALVIAAVFVPYMVLMVILGVYIYRTGHPREDKPPDTGDPGPAVLPEAA